LKSKSKKSDITNKKKEIDGQAIEVEPGTTILSTSRWRIVPPKNVLLFLN
jgi:hypothetical protein